MTIQLPRKIVHRDPIHIGVPLRTNQWVQHHLDQCRRTLSRLESTTWWMCRCNRYWMQVWVKTSTSTIPGFAPGRALPPRWSRKRSKDRAIQMDNRRDIPGLVEMSVLEMPNVNLYTTKKECYWQIISSRHSNSLILITVACKRVSYSINQQLTNLLS